ncbi:sensor domain-containing diguanylate cyclase [Algicola sagamiensis]|uniref:sensor domain-containing diguanylate cyclase n=1 Tax=Algicola sagamiensis TaxID=163869 RepID=UPI0004755F0F|nr:sensor domain-containing diguanylate cyclase [Algicola sagamiensis]
MNNQVEFAEFHWMMDMFQTVDIGFIVLDREYQIHVWNGFMENHSGLSPREVRGKSIFDMFSELDEEWFRHKSEPVFLLKNRAFTIWEQRPFVFRFRNYRPITGTADVMFQNISIIPLSDTTGKVGHICIIVYDVTDVAVNKKESEAANAKLEQLSRTDQLTGLNNRGFWETCLNAEFKRIQRTNGPCSLLMFDIDHFKRINDGFGHAAGDIAIRHTADLLRNSLRETDISGRYGGEEYAVILVDTPALQGRIFAERIRKLIEQSSFNYEGTDIQFTVSMGISDVHPSITTAQKWIEAADSALYRSKEGGRNRVSIYEEKEENSP